MNDEPTLGTKQRSGNCFEILTDVSAWSCATNAVACATASARGRQAVVPLGNRIGTSP